LERRASLRRNILSCAFVCISCRMYCLKVGLGPEDHKQFLFNNKIILSARPFERISIFLPDGYYYKTGVYRLCSDAGKLEDGCSFNQSCTRAVTGSQGACSLVFTKGLYSSNSLTLESFSQSTSYQLHWA
jgi:hypothetical protein